MSKTTTADHSPEPAAAPEEIFNQEALAYQASYRARGALLLRTSAWGRLAYPFIASTFVACLLFLGIARVPRRLTCPGVVQARELVASCPARQGAFVVAGAPATVTLEGEVTMKVRSRVRSVERHFTSATDGKGVLRLRLGLPPDADCGAGGAIRSSVEIMSAPVPLLTQLWSKGSG